MKRRLKIPMGKKIIFYTSFFLFLIIIFLVFSPLTVFLSAQSADFILRPLIGEKNTLFLESIYFGFQDKLNQTRYIFLGNSKPSFSPVVSLKTSKPQTTDQMNLSMLHAKSSLSPLQGEGVWTPMFQNLYPNKIIIAKTFIRPDATRPYAIVYLVKMDMKKLGIGTQAGTYYPGGTHGVYGPGVIPENIQHSNILLAAFNGGFQERDGHFGMIVGNKTYVPLRMNMPALILYKNGSIRFINYTGQALPSDVLAVRQNGPYLIKNGLITNFVKQGVDTWGRTITDSMYTWRSGLGITKKGNLIYAVGNSLVPSTLAEALLSAGSVNAIQLDINPPWVRFFLYQSKGNGEYTSFPLLTSMQGGKEYLSRYNKDFFYVYKKLLI